jgi:DNA polymerase elongation subunit (family B)
VKGIEAERRDVPRFVRQICKQALYDILVKNDVLRALENCKNSIRRVVAGKWSLSEYIMTGVSLPLIMCSETRFFSVAN